jgi:hypothetical protein
MSIIRETSEEKRAAWLRYDEGASVRKAMEHMDDWIEQPEVCLYEEET